MKLDRNCTNPRRGKYALIKLRVCQPADIGHGVVNISKKAVDFGNTLDTDFFVLRLKDKYAEAALKAYAESCKDEDPEFSKEVMGLAVIAANPPNKRRPD